MQRTVPVSRGDHPELLPGVRAFYRTGEDLVLAALPAGTCRAVARRARGDRVDAVWGERVRFPELRGGTYSVEALGREGGVLAEELTTVGAHPGERAVHGFATPFDSEDLAAILEWLRALRCTVVQIYDWMASYSAPLGPPGGVALVSMFTFSAAFDEFPIALTMLNTPTNFMLPIGLADFIGEHTIAWGPFFAASVIATVPVVIVFLVTQRCARSGVSLGGLR